MVYHYNNIVDDYNKFCELSNEVMHLKAVKQPELFSVKYPAEKPASDPAIIRSEKPLETTVVKDTGTPDSRPVEHKLSTVQQKVVHDTVYIEKRDTVYLHDPTENLRSMEGYAVNNMVLLLDVSGSMNAPGKLPVLKESVLELLKMMRPEDEVSIVVFSAKPNVILQPVSFKEEMKIRAAIEKLKPSGKTDGNAALKLAYKVADENYLRGGNNRIILATDGEFNVSDETRQQIEKFSKEDIYLTVFNFGKGMGSSQTLESLATLGKGNFESISKENIEIKLIREAKAKRQK
jgi:Mg-chelatase subunit ChlD